jgi:hypothetical protein
MATGTLTGQTIANTYKALLKITGTTAGGETLHATTQKVIEDGDGNPFPFSAAQDAILMTGTSRLEFNDNGEYISGDGTNLTITSGADIILAGTAVNITADTIDLSDATKDVTLNAAVDALNFDSNTLSIDATNNRIGIGTAAPTSKLDIQGNNIDALRFSDVDDNEAMGFFFQANSGNGKLYICTNADYDAAFTSSDAKITLNNNGSVGIGTTAPEIFTAGLGTSAGYTSLYDASGSVLELSGATDGNAVGVGIIQFVNTNNADGGNNDADGKAIALIMADTVTSDSNAGDDSGGNLSFFTKPEAAAYAERMRITSTGIVGIGNLAPAAKLDIQSGSGITTLFGADVNSLARTDDTRKYARIGAVNYDTDATPVGLITYDCQSASDARIMIGGGDSAMNAATSIAFHTAANATTHTGTARMNIDAAGDIGLTPVGSNFTGHLTFGHSGGAAKQITMGSTLCTHGVTGTADTNDYYYSRIYNTDDGGYHEHGLADTGSVGHKFVATAPTDNTTKTASGVGTFMFDTSKNNGTAQADVGADGNLFSVRNNGNGRFLIDEDGQVYSDGNHEAAFDYAEMFEWEDGNPDDEDRVGYSVSLVGDKVKKAEGDEIPIGIVSARPAVCGDNPMYWHGQYKQDEWGKKVRKEVDWVKWEFDYETEPAVEAIEAQDAVYETIEAVTKQKTVDKEVEEEVTTTETVKEGGKYVQKTTTKTVTKTVNVPQYDEVDLYNEDGEVIGKHQVPIMEIVEEAEERLVTEAVKAVSAVEAIVVKKTRQWKVESLPDDLEIPENAEYYKSPESQNSEEYDDSQEYIPRKERQEWDAIGLMGKLRMRSGQPTLSSWIKMKDEDNGIEMWLVK